MQTDKPHLVSLGSGRLSTAITLLPLEEGMSRSVPPATPPSLQTFLPSDPGMHWSPSTICWQCSPPPTGRWCHHQFASLVFASPDCLPSLVDNLAPRLGLKISVETRRRALKQENILLITSMAKKRGGPSPGQCLAWEKVPVWKMEVGDRPPKQDKALAQPLHFAASALPLFSPGCTCLDVITFSTFSKYQS